MDQHTKDNWRKVKDALEAAGKTDCFFYKRACAICRGQRDPFEDTDLAGGMPKVGE
jgi:hypothetical protein